MELNEDKSVQASAIFNKYAKAYQDKFMDVGMYGDSLKAFCHLMAKENAQVLDIACGPGNITKYLLSQKPGLSVFGIDLAPNMVSLARSNNPGAVFEVMDCRSIANLTEKFDAVVAAFCLPYLSKNETNKLFFDVNKLLNEGGISYISTMEDDYEKSGYETGSGGDQVFMHYYEGQYLTSTLENNGFEIVEIFRKPSILTNGKEVIDLVIISQKRKTNNDND